MSNRLGRGAPCAAAVAALALGAGCSDGDAGGSGGSPSTSVPFTLEEALAELPEGPGPLRAVIETEEGTLTCALHPDKAPIGVANFVGLARGRREWKDPRKDEWVKTRFYDGLLFHRVIDDFMAQGGDPLGTGYGGPGYEFANEDSDLRHEPGTLAYANAGRDTNGSQFYITETAQPMLDGKYTIFGSCSPLDVIQAITSTPTSSQDRPLEDLHMLRVEITRTAP